MSKAIQGVAMLGAAVGLGVIAYITAGAALAIPGYAEAMGALVLGGIAAEAGAIAGALSSNRGTNITTRQPAAFRQYIRGTQRVGGTILYQSTTGSHHDQYNFCIAIAAETQDAITALYLDGRQVFFTGSGVGHTVRNGVSFGGNADGNDHTGPDGNQYNFGGLVYCEACYGDQIDAPNTTPNGGYNTGLHANDNAWGPSPNGDIPWVAGICYVYLKIEYNPGVFPGLPEIKFTVRGNNQIFDPRTGQKGYTSNAALLIAEQLTALGLTVNQAQLIAAANVCEEQVPLAAGGTENRYDCHYHWDASTAPGDVMQVMLEACGGRISEIGGEWYIWPAYWQGPSFAWDAGIFAGPLKWTSHRPLRELCNRVTGTYTAPNYPYNATTANGSNAYDANGFDAGGQIQNNFGFAFQPTNFPQYAEDPLHGYPTDQYLNEDSGVPATNAAFDPAVSYNPGAVVIYNGVIYRAIALTSQLAPLGPTGELQAGFWQYGAVTLPLEVDLKGVLSVSQAQRLAKIKLRRNRMQGSGTFNAFPVAMRAQPCDVVNFTFAQMGWSEKQLEIVGMDWLQEKGDNDSPRLALQISVQETEASIYDWSTEEELTPYSVPALPTQSPRIPAAPTNLTLTSSAATAVTGLDGIVRPRVLVSWDEPLDGLTSDIDVAWEPSGAGTWLSGITVPVVNTSAYATDVVAGQAYDFRIRSRRPNGAVSSWVEIDGYTVGTTLSQLTQLALAPGTLVGEAFADGTAGIVVSPFTARIGNATVSVLPGGEVTLTGLQQFKLYFVYYVDPNFVGGAITPIPTTNQADYLNKQGYFLIDTIITPSNSSGGGSGGSPGGSGYLSPTSYMDGGSRTTQSPTAAYDGDESTLAVVSASATSSGVTSGSCTWSGWPPQAASASAQLLVEGSLATTISGTITGEGSVSVSMSIAGTFTPLTDSGSGYAVNIPSGTDLSTISVSVSVSAQADNTDVPAGTPKPSGQVVAKFTIPEIKIAS